LLLGRGKEYLDGFRGQATPAQAGRAVCLAYMGRMDEVRAIQARLKSERDLGSDEDESGMHLLVNALEASVIGHRVQPAWVDSNDGDAPEAP
jgi:hypothetical protein